MIEEKKHEELIELNYRDFLPLINEEETEYDEALKFALDGDNKIKNIAITGPYGAGKSSVFDSYLKKTGHPDGDIIRISLVKTHLGGGDSRKTEDDEEGCEGKVFSTSNLEAEIIAQLAAQLDSRRIPLSSFKRIDTPLATKRRWMLGLVVILLLSAAVCIFVSFDNTFNICPLFQSVSLAVLLVVSGILIFCIVETLIGKSTLTKLLKRVKLFNTEIELFESMDASISKHLNEVLYMLEVSKKSIIVFEDLDRYDNPNVYGTLRNLCFLLNERLCSQEGGKARKDKTGTNENAKKATVKFVYMVRDDLFDEVDRTKYFDFIIPVVPILDGANTAEFIKKEFEALSRHPKCRVLIEQSGPFIEDARTLHGIMNEFKTYNSILQKRLLLPQEKVLAIVIYKNLFPKDFARLQYGGGFVGSLLKNAEYARELQLDKIQSQIKGCEEEIQKLNDEPEPEGDGDYARQECPTSSFVPGRSELLRKERTELLEQRASVQAKSISQILTESPDLYEKLVEHVEDSSGRELETHRETQLSKKSPLIRVYLENGYIDESYRNYLSPYFGTSPSDRNFVLSLINEGQSMDYAFKINSPGYVLNAISPAYLRNRKSALNFDILNELLKNPTESASLIDDLLMQVIAGKYEDFIIGYIESGFYNSVFVDEIFKRNSDLFTILKEWQTPERTLARIIHEALCHCPDRITQAPDIEQITTFIGESTEFAKSVRKEEIELLSRIDSEFQIESLSCIPSSVIDIVIEGKLYYPSPECFEYALRHTLPSAELQGFGQTGRRICYSDIIAKGENGITGHLRKNLDRFIASYLKQTEPESSNTDNEESAIYILNSLADVGIKIAYLEQLPYQISKLERIEDRSFWEKILEKSKTKCTLENAFSYYLQHKEENSEDIPAELLSFISDNEYEDSETVPERPDLNNFLVALLNSSLSNEAIRSFLLPACKPIELPEYLGDIENRLGLLVEKNLIEVNEKNLTILKQYDENSIGVLVQHDPINLNGYIEMLSQGWDASKREMQSVIEEEHHIELKEKILELTDLTIRITDEISLNLYRSIIDDHFDGEDLFLLVDRYDTFDNEVKASALNQILNHERDILERTPRMSDGLLLDIARSQSSESSWDQASIKDLLVNASRYAARETLIEGFEIRGFHREASCLKGHQSSFDDTEQNRTYLRHLKERAFISSSRSDPHCPGKIRSYPKRKQKE